MKFSENGLYIERYIKCGNCGVLIYEKEGQGLLTQDDVTYCSQWCIDWKIARGVRRAKKGQELQNGGPRPRNPNIR
jgi:N-methylhydantoinase B